MTVSYEALVDQILSETNGIVPLEPAWVARDWLPPGRRLGLDEARYDVGDRGFICERWLASTTKADNRIGPEDEGLSYISVNHERRLLLRDAVSAAPAAIIGAEYAETHNGLGRLAKIFDFAARIPFHIHPPMSQARLMGRNSKEEAYYFPEGVEMGPHPETFFGLHSALEGNGWPDVLVPYLVEWNSDLILRHSPAYLQVAGEGFHLPSGILHAPGTALTIELQEDSDTLAMFQALNAGKIISKELLFKDVHPQRRALLGERALMDWIDWEANGDPYFYSNHHLEPCPDEQTAQPGGRECWLFGNSTKFSGKRLLVEPGRTFVSVDKGVYSVLVWSGSGTYGGVTVRGGVPGLDEFLVCHDRATRVLEIVNTGRDQLVVFKFFGPDINAGAPPMNPIADSA